MYFKRVLKSCILFSKDVRVFCNLKTNVFNIQMSKILYTQCLKVQFLVKLIVLRN